MSTEQECYLVTGAAGFLGRRLSEMLLAKGRRVRTFDRQPLELPGAEHVQGDLRDDALVAQILKDVTVVIHTASYISIDPREDAAMYEINIVANQRLLDASRKAGVKKFVYTSSIDVVYDGRPIRRGDETLPYPKRYLDYYGYSKATAEQAVLHAHDPKGMLTCALRAAGIFGPGDKLRVPSLINMVRKGNWFQIGKGDAEFNHVYVDNLAHAHILAVDALRPNSPVGGQTYFITDHEPSFFFDFFIPIFEGLGYRPKARKIAYRAAMLAARLLTWWDHMPWNKHRQAPNLTPYTVASTAKDFSFVHDKATRDFGYVPVVSREGAIAATIRDLRERGFAAHSQPKD